MNLLELMHSKHLESNNNNDGNSEESKESLRTTSQRTQPPLRQNHWLASPRRPKSSQHAECEYNSLGLEARELDAEGVWENWIKIIDFGNAMFLQTKKCSKYV